MNVIAYDLTGKQVGEHAVNKDVFGIEPNEPLMHEVLVAELAGARQGSASTKERSDVRGGGRKPRRQKGTGMARQGTIRAPQWVGGGVVHGPKPRSFEKKVNKKARVLALRSALSLKAQANEIVVLDNHDMEAAKTKSIQNFMSKTNFIKPIFVVRDIFDESSDERLFQSARNIKDVVILEPNELAIYWLLKQKQVIFTKEALARVEEVLG